MKKNIISVCALLLVTLFMFVSCSGSITDTLLKVMDSTNTNVFEQAGMVKPDTSAADNALKAMESIQSTVEVKEDGTINLSAHEEFKVLAEAGIEIQLKNDLAKVASQAVLAPQTETQKAEFKKAINSATNDASKKALEDQMKKEVSEKEKAAVQGTMAVTSGAIDSVVSKLKTETASDEVKQVTSILEGLSKQLAETAKNETAVITEADKVQAQLLTNIAVSAAKASEAIAKSAGTEEALKNPQVKELIDDTLTLYATAKIASGSVDILQTEGLFDILSSASSSGSKAVIEIDDKIMPPEIKKLFINLIKNSLGTDPDKYPSRYNSYKNMVESRNLTYAVIGGNKVTDSSLKATATTGSVLEFANAALFATLLDPSTKLEVSPKNFVSFASLLNDIVSSSPNLFTKYVIEAEDYKGFLSDFLQGNASTANYKDFTIDTLKKLVDVAKTADNMLTAGGLSVKDLLSALNISSTDVEIESLDQWLEKLINDMKN
ncbi:MAG: hypothetical protein SO157_08015 [Bullifex sp.]|nr:hypothetical protein [Spirochaetales bacterium]MDY4799270.1 hypothetical protein [Bullifex sp.]MDY5907319.1 hypothetical protein [Bullifex sp.]